VQCWDRVACRSEEAAAIYRLIVLENSQETSRGAGWLTGGNLAREERQEEEERKHARSFKDGSAIRLMHPQTEKHTQ
jgi:hypothetical protein